MQWIIETRWGNGEVFAWLSDRKPKSFGSWAMRQLPYGFDHYARGGASFRAFRIS